MKSLKYAIWLYFLLIANIYAAPVLTESEIPYEITGSTAQELRNEMNRLAPYYEGERYDSHTTWYVTWNYNYQSDNNLCHLAKIKVAVEINYYFPDWINHNKADQALQTRWDNYIKHLKMHEQGHAENGKNAANDIEAMLYQLSPMKNCEQLNKVANEKAQQIISHYNDKDSKYDDDTQHGATQGAVF